MLPPARNRLSRTPRFRGIMISVMTMASLAKTNPNLKNRKRLAQMIARSTYESSAFEGASARSLEKLKAAAYPRSKARSKKIVRSE